MSSLKQKGVLYFETEGKNKGCWVMSRPGSREPAPRGEPRPDEDAKVIVRSNGTVTYVGKDIAYHLGSSGCWAATSDTSKFFRYPDARVLDLGRARAKRSIRISAGRRPSTT